VLQDYTGRSWQKLFRPSTAPRASGLYPVEARCEALAEREGGRAHPSPQDRQSLTDNRAIIWASVIRRQLL